MRKTTLDVLLTRHAPGTWIVLDPEMSMVMGSGKTPETAMQEAGIEPVAKAKSRRRRPVMMQVPDPKMKFFGCGLFGRPTPLS